MLLKQLRKIMGRLDGRRFSQKVCEALIFLLDNIYIRFGSKSYREIVGIPMGTNGALL